MIAIAVRFLAGRYHATPWGRHVNEGVPEWPPSPWRLLRALISVWQRTQPDLPVEQVRRILAALAEPPAFHVPAAVPAYTRHYMPWFKKGEGDRTLVFDTFAAVMPEEWVCFIWPHASLVPEDQRVLSDLLGGLGYLGRAESWCEAALVSECPAANCEALDDGTAVASGFTPVSVLVPAERDPEVLLQVLRVETGEMRSKARRLEPPGSKSVRYARPDKALVSHPLRRAVMRERPLAHVARYVLDAKPLPLLTDAIDIGDLARRAVMHQFGGREQRQISPVLAGRLGSVPLQDQHRHAFYLPTDEDGDGRIDHLTIYAPAGFDAEEQQALARLDRLYDRERSIRLLLLGLGQAAALRSPGEVWAPATEWVSATPYLLTRHPKTYRDGRPKLTDRGEQQDGPEDQLRREWALRRSVEPALPELVSIERVPVCMLRGRQFYWLDFRRWRRRGGGATSGFAYGFALRFAEPVPGPIALGYGCHFGLGQFRPVRRGE